MKKTILSLFLFGLMAFASCSYADLSREQGGPIPDLMIDTTGIPQQRTVMYGQHIVIEPKVSCASNPERDFSYEWRRGVLADASRTVMTFNHETISREEMLRFTVDMLPDDLPYQLMYRVTDNKTGLVKNVMFHILVKMEAAQGLLVAHSNDGLTSDLALLCDTLFTAEYKQSAAPKPPTLIKHNLYSAANGARHNGIIKDLLWGKKYYFGLMIKNLDGHSGNAIFRLDLFDYSIIQENRAMFSDPNIVIDIKAMFPSISSTLTVFAAANSTRTTLWNNRSFQYQPVGAANASDYIYLFGIYSLGSWSETVPDGRDPQYDPDPTISRGSSYFMFYDKLNGRFLYLNSTWTDYNTYPTQCTYVAGNPFDSRSVGELEVLGAGPGNASDHRFVVKQDGAYKILSMLQSNGSARAVYNISNAPNIEKATHFAVCINRSVVYYATSDNEIYGIYLGTATGVVDLTPADYTKIWTTADPINGLYFTRQCSSTATYNMPIQYHGTALVATTTASQTEGSIWVFPFTVSATNAVIATESAINEAKVVSFSGFNRISTITMVE